ncbi:MAG: tRNA (N6-isopentenyl adenosine(37)-C2)-methylthiotransferase MiaB [Nitrospiraceae bacterium]|nr:tRNA (N6-isopentenyl adenosine(37)-C2)-methylthiotransferase MiaB [Nitrospiraceae bacterium]MSR23692.1 tRNA (N6-isopentenyl adenosine(37)-C2)-methylthiotransferase MiaB [Nitrospiraceae bacterium]
MNLVTIDRAYRVHIETFGCQMNEYDTELVRSLLKARGFTFTEDRERADVVLMNTCAIRENAHSKVYGHLAELKALKRQRHLVVGVLGCMAQNLKEELTETEPLVDVLAGPDSYRRLPDLLLQAIEVQEQGLKQRGMAVELSEYETYDDILPERTDGVNAWLAVMRGCDNFCSFCVVPYTRGRERSRDPQGIIRETEHLVAQGHKQVTLLGQNVNSYQFDAREGARLGAPGAGGCDWDFARLITAVADVPGIERVRFTSPHPKDFPPALLDAVAGHPKICKHIHLPLQSGNDRILDLMGRSYTRTEYLDLVDGIRKRNAEIALTTDIICGFCSETEEEFLDTYRVVQDVGFHAAYVFKYSERKHTIAARKYPDDVSEAIKSDRVVRIVDMQTGIAFRINQEMIGRTIATMVEGDAKRSSSQWKGRADNSLTVVWEKDGSRARPGDLVPITVSRASVTTLFGTEAPA